MKLVLIHQPSRFTPERQSIPWTHYMNPTCPSFPKRPWRGTQIFASHYSPSINLTKLTNTCPVFFTSVFTASVQSAAPAATTAAPPKPHHRCLHAPRLICSANVRRRVEIYVIEYLRRVGPRLDMRESGERWKRVRVGGLAALVDQEPRDDSE